MAEQESLFSRLTKLFRSGPTIRRKVKNYKPPTTGEKMDVFGYLIGDEKNEKRPRVVRRENAVEIRFARERIVVQDEDGEFRF